MNDLDAIKSSQSASFKKRNPHIFGQNAEPGLLEAVQDRLVKIAAPEAKKKRIRQSDKPLLNRLEKEFQEVLIQRYPGDMHHITAQAIRFSLGNGIAYKPDFVVFMWGRPRAYECKGPHAFRGGFENLKVAANRYPLVQFILVWKSDGQWQEQHVLP